MVVGDGLTVPFMYNGAFPAGTLLAIRLPDEIERRLDALAAATGPTKSFHAHQAILEHLDDLEDLYLAEQWLSDLRAGRTVAIPLDEVMKTPGLAD